MSFWRTTLFNLLFYIGSLIYALVLSPCLLTVRSTHWGIHLWARLSLWLMRVVLGLDYQLQTPKRLPQGGAIYASKHQSAWETISLWVLVPNPVFVMKRELYFIPFIGWWIWRAGNIGIDRSKGSAAMKQMLREAKMRLEQGYNIIVFPEGTRTKPGTTTTYRPGVTMLAKLLKCPVVPIALNSGLFWPRNAYRKKPGVIEVVMLTPIAGGQKGDALMQQLQDRIETKSTQLLQQ